jgi:Carboxypeptidase regulatory-like domain
MRVVLLTGRKVTGTVFDLDGKPVPNAVIKVVRKDGTHRKGTATDANGKFAVRGLSDGLTLFTARALAIKQKLHMPMAINGDKTDLEVRLKALPIPAGLQKHVVLGMQLADVRRTKENNWSTH